jgi:cytochrome c oxidase subunit 1
MLNETLGKLHFWVTFVGAYAIFFPMFLMGILGVPRRYFDFNALQYLPPQTSALNIAITVAALTVGAAQLIFLGNLIWSALWGKRAEANPWAQQPSNGRRHDPASARQLGRTNPDSLSLGL